MNELATMNPQVVTALGNSDVLVVAEQPGQMQAAQQALIAWAGEKVARVKKELADAEDSLAQATAAGLRLNGVKRMVDSARKTVTYYEKVQAALEDGYCIVPEFPVEIVAIRTSRDLPTGRVTTSGWTPLIEQKAESLPEGQGNYVDPEAKSQWAGERDEKNWKGEKTGNTLTVWEASEFREVGLPVKFMKPRVVEATNRAMLAGVFDEIGILPARPKKDPLIVGRIIDPKGKRLSFLISWFVDSRDL